MIKKIAIFLIFASTFFMDVSFSEAKDNCSVNETCNDNRIGNCTRCTNTNLSSGPGYYKGGSISNALCINTNGCWIDAACWTNSGANHFTGAVGNPVAQKVDCCPGDFGGCPTGKTCNSQNKCVDSTSGSSGTSSTAKPTASITEVTPNSVRGTGTIAPNSPPGTTIKSMQWYKSTSGCGGEPRVHLAPCTGTLLGSSAPGSSSDGKTWSTSYSFAGTVTKETKYSLEVRDLNGNSACDSRILENTGLSDPINDPITGVDTSTGAETFACSGFPPSGNNKMCPESDSGRSTVRNVWTLVTKCGDTASCEYYTPEMTVEFSCTSSPANATICAGDSDGLNNDTDSKIVESCIPNNNIKCEFFCNADSELKEGKCVKKEADTDPNPNSPSPSCSATSTPQTAPINSGGTFEVVVEAENANSISWMCFNFECNNNVCKYKDGYTTGGTPISGNLNANGVYKSNMTYNNAFTAIRNRRCVFFVTNSTGERKSCTSNVWVNPAVEEGIDDEEEDPSGNGSIPAALNLCGSAGSKDPLAPKTYTAQTTELPLKSSFCNEGSVADIDTIDLEQGQTKRWSCTDVSTEEKQFCYIYRNRSTAEDNNSETIKAKCGSSGLSDSNSPFIIPSGWSSFPAGTLCDRTNGGDQVISAQGAIGFPKEPGEVAEWTCGIFSRGGVIPQLVEGSTVKCYAKKESADSNGGGTVSCGYGSISVCNTGDKRLETNFGEVRNCREKCKDQLRDWKTSGCWVVSGNGCFCRSGIVYIDSEDSNLVPGGNCVYTPSSS